MFFFYCLNTSYYTDEVCAGVLFPLPFMIPFSISFLTQFNFLSATQQQLLINQNLQQAYFSIMCYALHSSGGEHIRRDFS